MKIDWLELSGLIVFIIFIGYLIYNDNHGEQHQPLNCDDPENRYECEERAFEEQFRL